jgi:hypothetical protein
VRFYDRDGSPIGLLAWTELFEDRSYQRVAEDVVGPYRVSTVWLGADHNFGGVGAPLIFETMVFGEGEADEETHRWCTEAEAVAGHEQVVAGLRLLAAATGRSGL